MATKYHINDKGEAGVCNAIHKCRFGRDAEQHYDSVAEARTAYEKEQVDKIFATGVQKDSIGKRDLNKLVKYTDDQEILKQGIQSGSPRVRASILKNRNADAETLKEMYETVEEGTGAQEERDNIIAHRNYPVKDMSAEQFTKAVKQRRKELGHDFASKMFKDKEISDNHKSAIQGIDSSHTIALIANNTENQLSDETRQELLNTDSITRGLGLRSGVLPASEIKNLNDRDFGDLAIHGNHIEKNEHIKALIEESVNGSRNEHDSENAIRTLAVNPRLTDDDIKAISAKTSMYDSTMYAHPNISEDTKQAMREKSRTIASMGKLEYLSDKLGGRDKLREKIIKNQKTATPSSSYHITEITFDKDALKELDMEPYDVETFMVRGSYNAGFQYDEEKGIFRGIIDSSG